MSEQDAETESDADQSAPDEEAEDGVSEAEEAAAERSLSEISAEPDGDVDTALENILGEESVDAAPGSGESESDEEESDKEEDLVGKIDQSDPETVADGIHLLRDEVNRLEAELAEERERANDLESRLKRKQADFQNYKKRQEQRVEDEIARATEDLVERLLDVRDNLTRALEQDEDADIRGGVESTLEQFDRELDRENVEPIEPEAGDELDPTYHEVLATIAGDKPEGTIQEVHRPGYEMAGKILRPAQVAVSDGSGYDDGGE